MPKFYFFQLQKLFDDEMESKRYAVRSSAIGEDGEELSSAGQNATILGCKGFEAVLEGLRQCWASLLSFQSVQYRHQHGEPLIPGILTFDPCELWILDYEELRFLL